MDNNEKIFNFSDFPKGIPLAKIRYYIAGCHKRILPSSPPAGGRE
jgi:hypothetical protein